MSIRGTGKLGRGPWVTTRTHLTQANKHTQTESLSKAGIIQERGNKFTVNSDQLKAKLGEKIDQIKTDLGLEINTPHGDRVTDKLTAIAHAIKVKKTVQALSPNQKDQLGLMCRELSQWCNTLHELNEKRLFSSSKTDQSDPFFKEFQGHIDRNKVELNGKAFANVSKRDGDHRITGLGAWSKFFDDVDMVNISQTTVTKQRFRNPTLNTTELTTQRLKQYSDNIKNSHNKDTSITTLAPTLAPGDTLTIKGTTYTIKSISDQHRTFELMDHNATTTQTLRIQNNIILLEETKITSEDIDTMPHRNTSHRYLEMAKTINHQKRTLQFKNGWFSSDKNQETLTRLAKENAQNGLRELTTAFFKTAGDKIDTAKLDALQPREQQAIQRLVIDLLMELNDVTTKEEPTATEIGQLLNTGDPNLSNRIYRLLNYLDTKKSTSQDILNFQVGERFKSGDTWHTVVKADRESIITESVSNDCIDLKDSLISDDFQTRINEIKPGDTISKTATGPQYTVTKINTNARAIESFTVSNKNTNEEETLNVYNIAADSEQTIYKFEKQTQTFSSSHTFSVPRTPWSHILADRMQQRLDSQNVADRLASRSLGARLSPSKMINKPNHGKTQLEEPSYIRRTDYDILDDIVETIGPPTKADKTRKKLLRRQKQLQNHHNTLLTAANDSLFKKEFQQTKRVVQSTTNINTGEKIIVNGVTYTKIKPTTDSLPFASLFEDASGQRLAIIEKNNTFEYHLLKSAGVYFEEKDHVTLSKNQAHELLTVIEPNAPEPSLTQLLQTICPEIPPTDLITNQNIQRAMGRMTALNHIKEKYFEGHSIQLTRNKFHWTCTIYDADGDKKHTLTLDDTTTGRINANQDTIETIFNETTTLSQLKQITMPDKIMEAISELTTESQIMDALQTPGPSNTSSNVLEHLLSDGTQTEALLSHVLEHCSKGTVTTLLCTKNSTGETPLHVAATNGQLAQTLKELNKLNPASLILVLSQQNNTGETPLHVAANKQDLAESLTSLSSLTETQQIQLLSQQNNAGETPLHVAANKNHLAESLTSLSSLTETQKIQLLSEKNNTGETPLHVAANKQHLAESLRSLTEEQQKQLLSQQNNAGDTPLHLFEGLGPDKGIDDKLLTLDALNIKNSKNETPLGKILSTSTDSLETLQKNLNFELKEFQDALKDIILDPQLHELEWDRLGPIIRMASSSDGTSIAPTQFMTLLEQNDNNGNTLLHALAKTDHFEAIMAMVKEHCTADQCTAVLSKQNNTGDTPLHNYVTESTFLNGIEHFLSTTYGTEPLGTNQIIELLTIENKNNESILQITAKKDPNWHKFLFNLMTITKLTTWSDARALLLGKNRDQTSPLQLAINAAQTPEDVKDIIKTCMDTINNPETLNKLWNHPSNGTHSLTTALERVKETSSKDSKKINTSAAIMASLIKHQVTPTNPPELQTVVDSINGLDPEIKKAFVDTPNLTALKTAISDEQTQKNNDCLAAIKTFEKWLGVEAALTVDDSLFQDRHELKDSVKKMIYDAMTSSSKHMKEETLQNIATFVTKTTSSNQIKNLLTTPLNKEGKTLLKLIITDAKTQNAHAQIILAHGLANVSKQEQQSILDPMTQWRTEDETIIYSGILKTIAEEQPELLTADRLNTLLYTWGSNETLILNILIPLAKPPEDGQPNDLKSIQPLLESTAIQTLIQSLNTPDESTKGKAIQCLEFIGATLLYEGRSLSTKDHETLHTILRALSNENIMGDDVLTDPIDRFLEDHKGNNPPHFTDDDKDNPPQKKPFTDDDIPTKSAHKDKPPPLKRLESSPSFSNTKTAIEKVLTLARLIKAKLTHLNKSADETPDSTTSVDPTRPPSAARSSAGPSHPSSAGRSSAGPSRPSSAGSQFASPSASQLAGLGVANVSSHQPEVEATVVAAQAQPVEAAVPPDQAAADQQGEAAAVPSPAAAQPGGGAPEATPEPPTVAARQRPQSAEALIGRAPDQAQQGEAAPAQPAAAVRQDKAAYGRHLAWVDPNPNAAAQAPAQAPAQPAEAAPDPNPAAVQQGEPAQERLRTRVARAKELNHEQKNFLDNIENLTVNPDLSSGQISITDIPTSRRSIKTETIRLTANDISKIYDELKKSSLKAHVKLEKINTTIHFESQGEKWKATLIKKPKTTKLSQLKPLPRRQK